jgi:D-methionine transport system ATP-binding protein
LIDLQGVRKVYPGSPPVEALKGIDLHIERGHIYGVVGFSGAGKSTLIRCVNLLERPTSGQVRIDGVSLLTLTPSQLRKVRFKIGMIFQQFHLLNSKTVFHNVALPLLLTHIPKARIAQKVGELLSFVGLREKANAYPDQLSGGQKQRVGIARALATDPHILLCDEATSALDPDTTKSILDLLRRIHQTYGITILMITHEMDVVRDICHHLAILEDGQIVEKGSVYEIFTKPVSPTAKKFVRTIFPDFLPASIRASLANTEKVFRVIFTGSQTGKPLLSQVAKTFAVDVNILHGNVTELQGKPFGYLLIGLQGKQIEIEQAVQFIQARNVHIEEVEEDGI